MDRSKSMAPFFGPKGVQSVLDLSLQDPGLQTTRVAFKFAPGAAADCAAAPGNTFSTFGASDIAFGTPESTRQGIAGRLADVANVTSDNPSVFWDAASVSGPLIRFMIPGSIQRSRETVCRAGALK